MSRRPIAPDHSFAQAPYASSPYAQSPYVSSPYTSSPYMQSPYSQPGTFDFREGLATANPFATAPPAGPYSVAGPGAAVLAANPMLALQQQQLQQQHLLQQQMLAAAYPGAPAHSPGVQAELAHAHMLASLQRPPVPAPTRAARRSDTAARRSDTAARRAPRADIHSEIRRCLDTRDKQGAYK